MDETVGDKDGQRLTVRVDLDSWRVYHPNITWRTDKTLSEGDEPIDRSEAKAEGENGRKKGVPVVRRMRDVTLIAMRVNPNARTPSGGKYVKIDVEVSVKTVDGYTYWEGTMRTGKDRTVEESYIVRLVPRGSRRASA